MIQSKLKPCPVCGKAPTFGTTLTGRKYVMCDGHCETEGRNTAAEAVELWNSGKYDDCDTGPKQLRDQAEQRHWPML